MSDFHGIRCNGCGSIVPAKGKTPELFRQTRTFLKHAHHWQRHAGGVDVCPNCVDKAAEVAGKKWGLQVAEDPVEEFATQDEVQLSRGITKRYNAKPYGFRFETRLSADPVDDGEGGTLQVKERTVEKSGMHFLGGEVLNYDEMLSRGDKGNEILLGNMKGNGIAFVVENRNSFLSTLPFETCDAVVNSVDE